MTDGDVVSEVWVGARWPWTQQSRGMEPACFHTTCSEALVLGLPGEPAPVSLEEAGQVYKLAPQEDPKPWRRCSGRPGPSPEARGALNCSPVRLDGRLAPRRPIACGSPLSAVVEGRRRCMCCGRPLCDRCRSRSLAGVSGKEHHEIPCF